MAVRILFITATRIGDAVLSTGLLDHLLRVHPDARFTVACGPVAEGVFARMPNRERTLVVDKRRFDLHWLTLWAQTVTHGVGPGGGPARLRPHPAAAGAAAGDHARRTPARAPADPSGRHARPGDAAAAGDLVAAEDHARAAVLLPPGGPIVALGPTANWAGKVWPAERFVALFHALESLLPGARAAVFAGPGAGGAGDGRPRAGRAAGRDRPGRPAQPAGGRRPAWRGAACSSATIPA